MKPIHCIFILLTYGLLASCQNQPAPQDGLQNPAKSPKALRIDPIPEQDRTKVIGITWVVDREGVLLKADSNLSSTSLGHYGYGSKLEIGYASEHWLGFFAAIKKEGKYANDYQYPEWIEEWVYIPRKSTGALKELQLVPSDLNKIIAMTKLKEKTIQFMQPAGLKEFLSMDLAFKVEYLSQKSRRVSALIEDSTGVTKKGNLLTLQLESKKITFLSEPEKEEQKTEYEYVGQIPSLNQYVLHLLYWESSEYSLIDKTTGRETIRLQDYPHVSPDGKYLLVLDNDVYKNNAEIELYTLEGNSIQPLVNVAFANWRPTEATGEAFWDTDAYFYVSIAPHNYTSAETQYLRIKIL